MTLEVTDDEMRAMIRQGRKSSHTHAQKRAEFWERVLEWESGRSVEGEEVVTEQQQLELEV